jgi:hypothetical protein
MRPSFNFPMAASTSRRADRARTRSSASLPSTAVLLRLSKRRLPGADHLGRRRGAARLRGRGRGRHRWANDTWGRAGLGRRPRVGCPIVPNSAWRDGAQHRCDLIEPGCDRPKSCGGGAAHGIVAALHVSYLGSAAPVAGPFSFLASRGCETGPRAAEHISSPLVRPRAGRPLCSPRTPTHPGPLAAALRAFCCRSPPGPPPRMDRSSTHSPHCTRRFEQRRWPPQWCWPPGS